MCLFFIQIQLNIAQGIVRKQKGGETVITIEQMKNGYYLLTFEKDGCVIHKVFAEPVEKVNVSDLEPMEIPAFKLMVGEHT